jgi:hypothetical protein
MVIRLFFVRPVISKGTYQHIVIRPWFPAHSPALVIRTGDRRSQNATERSASWPTHLKCDAPHQESTKVSLANIPKIGTIRERSQTHLQPPRNPHPFGYTNDLSGSARQLDSTSLLSGKAEQATWPLDSFRLPTSVKLVLPVNAHTSPFVMQHSGLSVGEDWF